MNILTNDFVKPEGQRELARFGLVRKCTFKNDFVKPEGQRELARFDLVRTDDKPRGEAEFTQTIPRREGRRRSQLTTSREERLSLLRLSRGAKEEDEVKLHFLRRSAPCLLL